MSVSFSELASSDLRDERPIMTEEDISVPSGRFVRDSSLAEFERALETLIVLAHSQGRNFLAYLLIMALMHLREEEDQGRPGAPTEAIRRLQARFPAFPGGSRLFSHDALSKRDGVSRMNEAPPAKGFAPVSAHLGAKGEEADKIGVLLVNLGTPGGTGYWSVRRYLKEFLSDRRVIETNRVLWWVILNGIVLTIRPSKSGAKYRSVWNEALDESPLRTITRSQSEKVAAALAARSDLVVDWAMRYGNPSIASRIEALAAQGCDRLLVFPLYPQYAASTTATVNDKAFDALKALRYQPAVRTVPAYPADPVYIAALAHSIKSHLAGLDWEPEAILASYHGLPKSYVEKGDPYFTQCMLTTERLAEALGPLGAKLRYTFQSRFGRAEWLQPYTDKTVEALARDGVMRLAIVTPGFAADCLETLEEVAEENKEFFLDHGGKNFTFIPCLNDSDVGVRVLLHVIERELKGWI